MKNILKIDISDNTYLIFLIAMLSGYLKNVFLITIIVLIHELGHVFFFLLFKIKIEKISLYPFGGITLINKKIHERIYKDLICSLGGILFQIIFMFIYNYLYFNGYMYSNTFNILKMYNISIMLFNLVPMIPLDGSKLLFSICSYFLSFKKSYFIMCISSFISLILFVIYNMVFKMNDLILYLFLGFMLIKTIKEFKYVLNKFYLERLIYDNYYNGIIYDANIDDMRLDKLYYFKNDNNVISEKKYLHNSFYRK